MNITTNRITASAKTNDNNRMNVKYTKKNLTVRVAEIERRRRRRRRLRLRFKTRRFRQSGRWDGSEKTRTARRSGETNAVQPVYYQQRKVPRTNTLNKQWTHGHFENNKYVYIYRVPMQPAYEKEKNKRSATRSVHQFTIVARAYARWWKHRHIKMWNDRGRRTVRPTVRGALRRPSKAKTTITTTMVRTTHYTRVCCVMFFYSLVGATIVLMRGRSALRCCIMYYYYYYYYYIFFVVVIIYDMDNIV